MGRYILLLAILLAQPAKADGNKAAHVLVSAGLTTGLYLLMSRVTGRKTPSLIGAAGMALGAGLAVEIGDSIQRRDRRIDGRDMAANAVGVGAASCAIVLLEF